MSNACPLYPRKRTLGRILSRLIRLRNGLTYPKANGRAYNSGAVRVSGFSDGQQAQKRQI
jgi:hypothetical protein